MGLILGIDPGSRVTGYGLVDVEGRKPRYVASGCIRLREPSLQLRLQTLYGSIQTLCDQYQPEFSAIEQVFVGRGADAALKLGHARGVAMLGLANAGLDVQEYAARAVKQAVAGSGAADKIQVQSMVCRLLALEKTPPEDAADALAVALCCAFSDNAYARAL